MKHVKLENAIRAGLISAIHAHGPITRELVPSAMKRIIGAVKNDFVHVTKEGRTELDVIGWLSLPETQEWIKDFTEKIEGTKRQ